MWVWDSSNWTKANMRFGRRMATFSPSMSHWLSMWRVSPVWRLKTQPIHSGCRCWGGKMGNLVETCRNNWSLKPVYHGPLAICEHEKESWGFGMGCSWLQPGVGKFEIVRPHYLPKHIKTHEMESTQQQRNGDPNIATDISKYFYISLPWLADRFCWCFFVKRWSFSRYLVSKYRYIFIK